MGSVLMKISEISLHSSLRSYIFWIIVIGLDILAVTPAEIAISVAAECIQVRALAGGGRKNRHCPA